MGGFRLGAIGEDARSSVGSVLGAVKGLWYKFKTE